MKYKRGKNPKSWFKKGHKFSKKTIEKMRKIKKDRLKRDGFINSPETRIKMSKVQTGKKLTKETKEKLKGRMPWNKGKKGEYHLWPNGRNITKETKRKMSEAKQKMSEKTKKKMSEAHKGKCKGINHWRWIIDRTKLNTNRQKAYDTKYKYWMKRVKNRDNWKCKINNKDCCGRLEAHHILPWSQFPELRYEINNGITLCHFHHPRKRNDEKKLIPIFKELVKTTV